VGKLWKVLGVSILAALLVLVAFGSVAGAQGDFTDSRQRSQKDYDALGLRLREMVARGALTSEEAAERDGDEGCGDGDKDWARLWQDVLIEVAAAHLGMTTEDLWAELDAGVPLADLNTTKI